MENKNTLFKNTIYKSILSFVNIIVPLIIGPYITRLLDPELYGIYNKNLSIFQVFLAFASFGIYTYGVREISKFKSDKKKVSKLFTDLFVISVITNILTIIIFIIYSFLTSKGISLHISLILSMQIIANIFYIEFVNEALENFKFITIKSIIIKLMYFAFLILFIKKPDQILLYSIIVSLTIFLDHVTSFLYAKKKIKFDFSKIQIKKYIKPLLIVVVMSNVDLLFAQLDKVMLGKYVSNISVTTYYIAYFIVATITSIPYSIINVSIPRLSYILKNDSKTVYEEKLENSISSLLFLIIPMCFGILVLSKEIIFIYSGEKYASATLPLMIAAITRIFISLESVINNLVLYPNNLEKRIVKVSLVCGCLNLILNYVLVIFNVFSPSTALVTTGLSELLVFAWQYVYLKEQIKIKVFTKRNFLYLLLGLLFIPISYLVRIFDLNLITNTILIIILCALMYLIVLYYKKDKNLYFILEKFKIRLMGDR